MRKGDGRGEERSGDSSSERIFYLVRCFKGFLGIGMIND